MKNNKRRKKYLGTALQKRILFLVFAAAVAPAAVVMASMYYLIFSMLAEQMAIPEAIAYNLMPVVRRVNMIIGIAIPVILLLIWIMALELSHRIVGPVYRIEKELDEIAAGQKKGPITIRKKDEFKSLVDKLNRLIFR